MTTDSTDSAQRRYRIKTIYIAGICILMFFLTLGAIFFATKPDNDIEKLEKTITRGFQQIWSEREIVTEAFANRSISSTSAEHALLRTEYNAAMLRYNLWLKRRLLEIRKIAVEHPHPNPLPAKIYPADENDKTLLQRGSAATQNFLAALAKIDAAVKPSPLLNPAYVNSVIEVCFVGLPFQTTLSTEAKNDESDTLKSTLNRLCKTPCTNSPARELRKEFDLIDKYKDDFCSAEKVIKLRANGTSRVATETLEGVKNASSKFCGPTENLINRIDAFHAAGIRKKSRTRQHQNDACGEMRTQLQQQNSDEGPMEKKQSVLIQQLNDAMWPSFDDLND